MKRVLITGAGGQIGSQLTRRLLQDGNSVVALDNFSTSNPLQLHELASYANLSIANQNVRDEIEPLGKFEEIYHLAAPASPVHYLSDPLGTMITIQEGTQNVLNLAMSTGAKILIASTSEIYGDPSVHPQTESYRGNVDPTGLRACYKESKRYSETLAAEYQRSFGVETRIARIFNTYGPGANRNDGRVIPEFLLAAIKGEPLHLHNGGIQTRSYCYVDDMLTGLIGLMESKLSGIPVNLGNPEEITVKELASLILQVTGSESPIIQSQARADDPSRRRPDISLAHSQLGWYPVTNLVDGLAKTAQWMKTAEVFKSNLPHWSERQLPNAVM